MATPLADDRTEVGNYFISNYPPYSFWRPEHLPKLEDAFHSPPGDGTQLGLYIHIPFCRKRCKFCYFKVYTDKNSREVERYLAALSAEIRALWATPAVRGRRVDFVYFGGGTPSYISAKQLRSLVDRLPEELSWENASEVTFECEPGTLQESKLETIREIGVTRLSLGIENFNDRILEENGRAHRSPEVYRAYEWATRLDFRSINVDLIAGMVGETNENWRENIRRTIELSPDSVTIYQMELPYNTIYSKDVTSEYSPVADWKTKREWVDFAFAELQAAGYHVSSAYTLVKRPDVRFVYRDGLWHGADLLGAGVSSFGHLSGIHYQNEPNIDAYCDKIERGEHPWQRAFPTTSRQRMIRELILQLKTGAIERGYFANKFGSDPLEAFPGVIDQYRAKGLLTTDETHVRLTREGLLRADAMLEAFFDPDHRGARYT